MNLKPVLFIIPLILGLASCGEVNQESQGGNEIPRFVQYQNTRQLMVDGKPFLMISGELRNSSSSNEKHIDSAFAALKAMNLNTVIASLSWQLIEPEEGKFDMHWIDFLVEDARKHDLKLVLIWFASYKNAFSRFIPDWVKKDMDRFPLSQQQNGNKLNRLSEFSENSRNADAKAFVKVMEYIKKIDSRERTVIMMQVQNEAGMLTDSRDFSPMAEEAFRKEVPGELMDYLTNHKADLHPYVLEQWEKTDYATSGTWEEVFGAGSVTDEFFQAWHLAKYIDYIAGQGREAYNLPMYANAWLARDNPPGRYPTGGPVERLHDIWWAATENLDLLAPDIYHSRSTFKDVCKAYTRTENPLFIPETRNNNEVPLKATYVFAEYDAVGYAPFAVDDFDYLRNEYVTEGYAFLNQIMPLILKYQGTGKMRGFLYGGEEEEIIELGPARFRIQYKVNDKRKSDGGGLIIHTGGNQFIVAGSGATLRIQSAVEGEPNVNVLTVWEGHYENGEWVRDMCINGDELFPGINLPAKIRTGNIEMYNRFSIQHFSFITYGN